MYCTRFLNLNMKLEKLKCDKPHSEFYRVKVDCNTYSSIHL